MVNSNTAFPREHRLTSGNQFSRVFGKAERSSDQFFTVLARLNDISEARLGLAISKRVAPRAVDRNRLRRLARESFRLAEHASLDYVVMANRDAITAANPVLRSSLERHFARLCTRAATKA